MSMHRPIHRRPIPKSKGRHLRSVGDAATTGAVLVAGLLFVLFWLAAAVLPLALMAAVIHWLVTH